MTDYIFTELFQNEFRIRFAIEIGDVLYRSDNLRMPRGGIKIDTGAVASLVPLRTLGMSEARIQGFKYAKIRASDIGGIIRGVESSFSNLSMEDVQKLDIDEIMNLTCLKFSIPQVRVSIQDIQMDLPSINVTTDTTGNILLGMDVLRLFDYHGGVSKISGRHTFIGCPLSRMNDTYRTALEKHFGFTECVDR